jgi:uncharacterized repeat protein (TIGR01451 family)
MGMARYIRVTLAVAIALVGAVLYPAAQAANTVAEYGHWTMNGKTGTVEVPVGTFPAGDVTTNSTRVQVPSGMSSYLNDSTPFGQEFGSSRGHNYLQFGAVSATVPSKTTITFDKPTPAGDWGFALGDIDAEKVQVIAAGADGKELSTSALGWRGAFNYCNSSPKPSSCGSGASTDEPVWDSATDTLVGHGPDTNGASGWFMPTKPVKSLTLKYTVLIGIPTAQLWIAAESEEAKPDVHVTKRANPTNARPGSVVTYTITVSNEGTAEEPLASFTDDLSDVIDDAHYLDDAKASGGTVTYRKPVISWEGAVPPHESRTVTYRVRIDDPVRGNGIINNVVVTKGRRLTCDDGKGAGCSAPVRIAITVPCRAALNTSRLAVTRYGC